MSLLDIQNLTVAFDTEEGELRAVNGVSLRIAEGEVMGLVGESGCGKTVTALSILRLLPRPPARIVSGKILLRGQDLLAMPIEQLRQVRGKVAGMIFQEPMTALSPLHRIGHQLVETQQLHAAISFADAWANGTDWLRRVGIPDAADRMHAWPHQLSGGMRQRVMIAMTLMLEPDLIIADEPTTALDVTVQAQIFKLLLAMKRQKTAILLITHDMGVVWDVCDRVSVMYAAQIVEQGRKDDIFHRPHHPYTQGLLAAMPRLHRRVARLPIIPGQLPSLLTPPAGCRFQPRCPHAFAPCAQTPPPLKPIAENHASACFLP